MEADNRAVPLDWGTLAGEARTCARLNVLLRLTVGEVPYDRGRGLSPGLVGRAVGLSDPEIRREVDRMMRWEPAAKLADLAIEHQRDGAVLLSLKAEVR